jgi:hypothetical protein
LHCRKILMSLIQRIFLFLLIVCPFSGSAQSSEIGLFLGTTTYKGEINPSLFTTRLLSPAIGVLYRKNMNNHWAHRFGLNYGRVAADDALSDDDFKKTRNLSFRSNIFDLHYYLEFNFFPYQIANSKTTWSPFIFVGINGFLFNPQAEYNGEWYSLQPLGTEGQGTSAYSDRTPYKRLQVAIPFGGGVKFKLSRRFGMSIEAGARRLYTDYLDDVSTTYADPLVLEAANGQIAAILADRSLSAVNPDHEGRQRGNASDNDWYMYSGITINYTLSKRYNDNCTPFKGKLR